MQRAIQRTDLATRSPPSKELRGLSPMRRVFHLPALVSIVWAAWVGLVAAMAVMLALQVWHPHYLPVTVLLVALVLAGVSLDPRWFVAADRRAPPVAGPDLPAAGPVPLLFFAGHFLYGLKVGYSRDIQLDLPLKMLVPFGESFFDLLTRFQYPVRTGGKTVVMIAEPMPACRAGRRDGPAHRGPVGAARWICRRPVACTGSAARSWAWAATPSTACAWAAGRASNRPTPMDSTGSTGMRSPIASSPASCPPASSPPPC